MPRGLVPSDPCNLPLLFELCFQLVQIPFDFSDLANVRGDVGGSPVELLFDGLKPLGLGQDNRFRFDGLVWHLSHMNHD
jgi:hypothetical protein